MGEPRLEHLDREGRARVVDVGAKPVAERRAVARATVRMAPATAAALLSGNLPKGDAVAVARIAGIMAAKRTAELIPLCHPLALTGVDCEVSVSAEEGRVTVTTAVRAADRTGVEMEALVAAAMAALTVYDMVKALERGVVIERVELVEKTGGTGGDWRRS